MAALSIWHILIILVALAFYVLPAIVAYRRAHQNRFAILALDLLLGWTALGWIAALVWALTEVRHVPGTS